MGDDFLAKKKEDPESILDLSKAVVNSKEDFRRLFDKVPDFKMRPVKVRQDEIKIKEKYKDFKFKTGKKDLKILKEPFNFQEPLPPEMVGIKLEDLVCVPINWTMLTTQRPKLKVDEEYFSKLVELGKSQMKTNKLENKKSTTGDPFIRKSKNKSGVVETRAVSCIECGEEFCDGKVCGLFSYDLFSRVEVQEKVKKSAAPISDQKRKKKKIKRKSRSKSRTKHRDRAKSKSKSPMKSASRSRKSSKSKKK